MRDSRTDDPLSIAAWLVTIGFEYIPLPRDSAREATQ